ncbi:hypothetical protein CO583_01850 [Parasaccharibacter sp. TMW2.1882]|uniref:hypothetical protein n=1 Tax=Parasaccharibacter sp. TMW2.1882 TaxID=2039286 RepID=UPI00201124C7|nr:hypothetical protein [Parasaccharibacter sp. TMW2.1882]MCL1496253.1 hypothetical protein [Parasaccharibacter sp. TMW2.1882]
MALIASKAFSDVRFDLSAPIKFDRYTTQPPRIDRGHPRTVTIMGTSMTTKKVILGPDGKKRIGVRDNGEAAPDAVMLTEVPDSDWEALKTIHASHPMILSKVIRRVGNSADAKSVGRDLAELRTHDRRLPIDRGMAAEEAQKRAQENRASATDSDDPIAILERMGQ